MHSTKNDFSARISSAGASLLCLCAVVLSAGCGGSSSSSSPPPPPPPQKTTYTGTLFMASEAGGHVAVVPVTIDPSNATAPIALGTISRIQLREADNTQAGTGPANHTHVFHDIRLDGTKLYYSAIFTDTAANPGMVHLGYVDVSNLASPVSHDAMIDATAEAVAGMAYCGSGQTATHFFPMTMSSPAYIDAIAKSAIVTGATLSSTGANVKRTMVDSFRTGADPNYLFAHGVNSPDQTKLYVAVNETASGAMTGAITSYLMNVSDVVAGTVTASNVTSHTVTGLTPGMGTIAFRSSYTPDGTKILQAGSNRLLVLKASDLTVLDNNMNIGGSFAAFTGNGGVQAHDVMSTPDGKYALLSLRFQHANSQQQDSGIQLYDLAAKAAIGNPVSTCSGCHDAVTTARPTCGLQGNLTAVTQ